mmetsp:Transcript_33887/g.97653  ORF Transcript_33887/g.97653 Transcript_33887/m.97653 type:complete len:281 (+) Transcript_33887:287-1129(+)
MPTTVTVNNSTNDNNASSNANSQRAAIASTPPPPPLSHLTPASAPSPPILGLSSAELDASQDMCAYCFDVVIHDMRPSLALSSDRWGEPLNGPVIPMDLQRFVDARIECPLFVTWCKKRRGHEHLSFDRASTELRGCIGCLDPIPIEKMGEYAIKSGMQDKRFPPLHYDELPLVICKISLLCRFQSCVDADDWVIGVHGVLIRFPDPHNGALLSATYLPEVPLEHNMSKEVAIRELIRKAGYRGPIDGAMMSTLQVTRYESAKASLTYDEYVHLYNPSLR